MNGSQPTPADRQSLIARLEWAEGFLQSILNGDKPLVDPAASDQKWLYDQLTRMYAGHYLCSPPNSYVTLPGDTPALIDAKGDTRFHPVSARFSLNQKRKLVLELASANISNFHVMGSSDQPAADSDHYILVPSGIEPLCQSMSVLLQKCRAEGGPGKMIVIQNADGFWDPLVNNALPEGAAVVTSGREETKDAVLYSGQDIQKDIPLSSEFPDGVEILFGSTQPKKGDETGKILLHEKVNAGLKDAVIPLHWFLSADELSRTYEGNTFEKIDAMLKRVYDHIGYDEICRRLRERGFNPERVVFCANDTGVSYSLDFSQEPEFAAARAEHFPGKAWPDVELGPVVDAMGGITRFMDALKRCYERKGLTEPLRYRDTQLYMSFKLTPERKDVRVRSFFGTASGCVTFNPRPVQQGSLYTEHFHVPDGQPNGVQGKTQAELGDRYLFTDSPQARAIRTMMQEFSIAPSSKFIFAHMADNRNHRSRMRLLTQHNWVTGAGNKKVPGLEKMVSDENWKLSRKIHPDFELLAGAAESLYLGYHNNDILARYDSYRTRLALLFCKACTHKQVLHDVMMNKQLLVANPELDFFSGNGGLQKNWADPEMGRKFIDYIRSLDPAEHPWGQMLALLRFFHENSLVKQQSKYLLTQVTGNALPALLREARDKYSSHSVTLYNKEEYGQDRTDLFSVTVLGSASTRNPLYTGSAYYLGQACAAHDIHGRCGGGRYGIMGAFSEGMMDYHAERPQLPGGHLSAIQMPRTVQFEGLAFDIETLDEHTKRYVAIEPGMDSRMLNLFRSDVIIMDAGGLGTLEELLFFIDLKKQNHPLVRDKPLIIINHAHLGPEAIRLYDPLLATLSESDMRDIIVVPDAETAMNLTLRFRREGYRPQNQKKIAVPGFSPLSPA